MTEVIHGDVSPARLAAFLMGLRAKGETADEVAGLVQALHQHGTRLCVPGPFVDIVGTGGDGSGAVNISTMASVVVAATGTTVVKHGGRGASTSCGSADVLECLGLDLDLPVERVAELAVEVGITYCFAPRFHPGLRHAAPTRRELGVPTVFNVLAPLINPARPEYQLVGVAPSKMTTVIADVLAERKCTALVVRGDDGMDKLTTTTTSQVWIVKDGQVVRTMIDPRRLGIPRAEMSELRGGSAPDNAALVRRTLGGEHGPIRDVVVLNAAAALVAMNPCEESLSDDLMAALAKCADAIDSGAAANVLTRWIAATHRTS